MATSRKQTTVRLALSAMALVAFSCQPVSRTHPRPTATAATKAAPIIEEELISTSDESNDGPIVKNGVTYQAPPKKISNPHGDIILGRSKMEKTKIIYDPSTNELTLSGSVRILDENKNEIGRSDFNLSGHHDDDDSKFVLRPTSNAKSNSFESPLVRAKVTCLARAADGSADCSKAFVDFFIRYKSVDYTEQMELAQKQKAPEVKSQPSTPTPSPAPVPTPTPDPEQTETKKEKSEDKPPAASTEDVNDDLQSEGKEESIDGRYQGHAETVELDKIFEGDEAPKTAATPAPETASTPTPTPTPTTDAKPEATPQTTPQPEVKPEAKPEVKPEVKPSPAKPNPTTPVPVAPKPPASPDKKEKPISKDLQQTKNGDIRQINQSVGFPDNGNLRNATSLLAKQQALNEKAFFEVASPDRKRHFATYEMAEMISRLGQVLNETFHRKLFVGNISAQAGGKLSPHLSHQIGIDADLGYPTAQQSVKFPVVVQMSSRQFNSGNFSVEKTYELLKNAFSQSDIKVDRIFADRTIKKALCEYAQSRHEFNSSDKDVVTKLFSSIDHVDGHGDHFHLRLKCSAYDPGCRQKIYAVNKGCN